MPKDIEFPASAILQTSPSNRVVGSSFAAPASSNSGGGNGSARSPPPSSPAAAKYRVGFARTASSATPSSPSPAVSSAPSSPKARSASQQVSAQNASSILAVIKKTSSNARFTASKSSMLASSIAPGPTPASDTSEPGTNSHPASPKAKLPLKLRQSVSRLRSQFALVTSPSPSSFSTKSSGLKLAHRVGGLTGGSLSPSKLQANGSTSPSSRTLMNLTTAPTALLSPSDPKYSSQSYKMQTLQAQLSMLKMSTRSVLKDHITGLSSSAAAAGPAIRRPAGNEEEEEGPARSSNSPSKEDTAVHFFDLLRPLQNSLSCASLMSEWASGDEDQQGQQGELKDDQQPQSPERHRSRMLRICCSVDNLLLSIGNQVQEEKHDEAIARGAARQLLELFQFAINQVSSALSTPAEASSTESPVENNNRVVLDGDDKELQYMQEFIVEIVARMSRLDQFVRSTFISEISDLNKRIDHDTLEMAELKLSNAQLQTEMSDLRDFYSQNNMSVLGFARNSSNSSLGVPPCDAKGAGELTKEESQERMASLFPAAAAATNSPPTTTKESPPDVDKQLEQLRAQCDEFARLLEMAKQEIRLCHREHDVQKSRIAELSNAMFKDQELTSLRNQLQSEKRRVKNLEIENVSLRENQIDQTMKIQSLLANGAIATAVSQTQGETKVSDSPSKPTSGSVFGSNDAPSDLLRRQSSSNSTPPTSPKRKGNSSANLSTLAAGGGGGDESSRAQWFHRVLGLLPSQQESVSRKKHQQQPEVASQDASQSFVQEKQLLSGLLMSEKQVAVAQALSKIRRQGNVPTINPPVAPSPGAQGDSSTITSTAKKKKKPAISIQGDGNPAEEKREVVIVCQQLIWFFYQRFLMLEEANALATPRCLGATSFSPQPKASLASAVLQFFLERKPSRSAEDDENALLDATRFVKCLHQVRCEAGDVRFFCEFLEGARSREELCLFLWVLQVIDDTKVGISYEVPLASFTGTPTASSRSADVQSEAACLPHICLLKATFLTRIIYRMFHVRALKRAATPSSTVTKTANRKASGSTRALASSSPSKKDQVANGSTPASPASSPRRKRKSRVNEEDLRPAARPSVHCAGSQASQQQSLLDHASECFHNAVVMNNGAPLTLEAFNALITQFTVAPSAEELRIRLGPFFHPTGDEKKLVVEVFLVLIMEMFAHQLTWRKKQMRELFVTLAQHLEAEQVARQLRARELAEAAALKGKRPSSAKSKPKPKSPVKVPSAKKKPSKKKKRDHARDSNSSKYLVGLTRALLRQFLVQSGIVSDVLTVDVDQLFVATLELSGRSAKEIHFDELYEVLSGLGWLGNRDLQVDPTTTVLNQQWQSTEDDVKLKMLASLKDLWLVQSKQSLALCENDPNVFLRKRAKLLTESISQSLALSSGLMQTPRNQHFWCSLQSIREFLGFSWRIAAKRSGENQMSQARDTRAPHWFLSEFFFVNQAIDVVGGEFPGYQHPQTLVLKPDKNIFKEAGGSDRADPDTSVARNDQSCFWDTSRMAIDDLLIKHGASKLSPSEPQQQQLANREKLLVQELEHVLKRFYVYLAHLFASYSSAASTFAGLTLDAWLRMTRELKCVDKKLPDLSAARDLFFRVYSSEVGNQYRGNNDGQLHNVWISRSQFTALLIRVAFAKAKVCDEKKHPTLKLRGQLRPAQIVLDFCHQVIVPTTFQQRERLQEVDFVHKLSCPLVGRVLLEHRAFLRIVFFYYAKQDEEKDERREITGDECPPHVDNNRNALQDSGLHGFQLGKTERNSMNFDEFQAFLITFELLVDSTTRRTATHLDIESARLVFCSVMALENADTSQMEFEEFAAAVAALAVYRDPCPFRLWHVKIDALVVEMQRIVARKALRFD
ncbi:hypothetical protein Gpo141_00012367 [Globisporangium polare]